MEMEGRQLSQEEIAIIVQEASDSISQKLNTGAVLIPKLIKAAFEFYRWLTENNMIEKGEDQSRDIIAEMLLSEMKKRSG